MLHNLTPESAVTSKRPGQPTIVLEIFSLKSLFKDTFREVATDHGARSGRSRCSPVDNLTPASLELGGKSPMLVLAAISCVARAAGYSSSQVERQPSPTSSATPQGQQYPGCHNSQLNVESGGTTQGDANPNDTRYVEVGQDQMPNDPNSKATPTVYQIGYPGNTGSPHASCVAANTDGPGSGGAPT